MRQNWRLKGFRDFYGKEAKARQRMREIIQAVFESFGFEPLETPVIERAEVLTGKYGEEADKLVYLFKDKGDREVGLRYDLTVPTARFLAENLNTEIFLPFKRYQIQDVFRAEKPQKGRLREFTQADVDIYGIDSPLATAEVLLVLYKALKTLRVEDFVIELNSRKLVMRELEVLGIKEEEKKLAVLRVLDKLDKKSQEEVEQELKEIIEDKAQEVFSKFSNLKPSEDLSYLIKLCEKMGIPSGYLRFSPYLVRGLDYYTDEIFEFKLENAGLGSIAGGGRYDELIERLSGFKVPAVGGSLGFERIYEIIKEDLLKDEEVSVFVTTFSPNLFEESFRIAERLRNRGFVVEFNLKLNWDLKKQFKYADRKGYSWVVVFGEEEKRKNSVKLKQMSSGEEFVILLSDLEKFEF